MKRETISDLVAFLAVARAGSFTRAAAKLGISQSALSHVIRGLETRLGLRLLARTTRSVAPTEAGARLLQTLAPRLDEIEAELTALAELRDRPTGTIRINTGEHASETVLMPRLAPFLRAYPDIKVDITIDQGLADIVAGGFDAGLRAGENLDRDMIAVRVGPDLRMAVVATPEYFANRPRPLTPQDLTDHVCINLRLQSYGGLYAWEFAKAGRALKVRVQGPVNCDRGSQTLLAARAGLGLAYVVEDRITADLASGRLIRVLEDWCQPYPGYYLYYPSRRQPSAAFALFVEALRFNPASADSGAAPP